MKANETSRKLAHEISEGIQMAFWGILGTIVWYIFIGFLILMSIIIILGFIQIILGFIQINNYEENLTTEENNIQSTFSLEICPKNMNIDKYHGDYSPSLNKKGYDDVHDYILQDYIEAFLYDMNNSEGYVISSNNDAKRQGINMESISCSKSDEVGANINYIYCDGGYNTPQKIDENGIIQPPRYYKLKWIIDKRECVIIEPSISEEYGGWISGAKFECHFKELGCREI